MHFSTSVVIDAPPREVWDVLVDLAAWPTWNTAVTGTEGTVAAGSTVTVTVTANPGRAFPVRVAELEAPHRMVWRGGMPFGLFTGTRTFALAEQGAATTFSMDEVYAGPMAGIVTRAIPDLQPSFDEFAACLKNRVENARATS